MVGDAKVFEAQLLCGGDHVLQRGAPIAGGGVVVECAAQVGPFDEARQLVFLSRLDLAAILAQLRLHGIESKGPVDVRLLVHLRQWFAQLPTLGGAEAVFVQRPATRQCPRAHPDIVLLAAGEIIQGEREFGARDRPQVALDPVLQADAGLRRPAREHCFNKRVRGEKFHDRSCVLRRNQEVEVAHDFLFPPVASGDLREVDGRVPAQVVQQMLRERRHIAVAEFPRMAAHVFDRLEDVRRRLFPEPRQRCDIALFTGTLEARDRMDFERIPQCLDLFAPQSLHLEKCQNVGRKILAQVVVIFEPPRCRELCDFFPGRLADAFDRGEPFLRDELLERFRERLQRAGGVGVGADLERILALQLQQPGDVFENNSDLVLVHCK